jgi:acid phosphatase family membrane protein YuiD
MDEGIASPLFAVVVVFALIIIRDVVGLRMYLGRHGHAINRLIRTLPNDELSQFPVMREKLGHTYGEATVGGLLGIVSAFILYSVWP